MREMHRAMSDFTFPKGAKRNLLESVLESYTWRLGDDKIFLEALKVADQAFAKAAQGPAIPIHFDLHFGNVKLYQGQLGVFDFDDSVLGWPIIDAAQSLFYTRRRDPSGELQQQFWEHFGSTPEEHGITSEDFEALLAGRVLLLANDITGNVTAGITAWAQEYVEVSRKRLQVFLDTGVVDMQIGIEGRKM